MKFKHLVALLVMVVLFFIAGNTKVEASTYQEEVEQLEEAKSDSAKWFDKEMQDKLITYGFTFIGTISGMCVFINKLKNIKETLSKSNNDNITKLTDMESKVSKDLIETKKVFEQIATLKEEILNSNSNNNEMINKMLEVFKLAFANDPTLVKNGTAAQIVELIEGVLNEKTN